MTMLSGASASSIMISSSSRSTLPMDQGLAKQSSRFLSSNTTLITREGRINLLMRINRPLGCSNSERTTLVSCSMVSSLVPPHTPTIPLLSSTTFSFRIGLPRQGRFAGLSGRRIVPVSPCSMITSTASWTCTMEERLTTQWRARFRRDIVSTLSWPGGNCSMMCITPLTGVRRS
jgi:hypothetical protein